MGLFFFVLGLEKMKQKMGYPIPWATLDIKELVNKLLVQDPLCLSQNSGKDSTGSGRG